MAEHKKELTPVSVNAARAIAEVTKSRPALYLPGTGDEGPVLYREEGVAAVEPDFQRLKEAGVSWILVQGEELNRCEEMLESNLTKVLSDPHIPAEHKAACVQQVGKTVVREILEAPDPSKTLDRATSLLDVVIDGVLANPAVAGGLLQMSSHHQTTASHMFAVSTLGILLAADVFGPDEQRLKEVGLAGMLHDLGKLQIDPAILNKETPLTPEEMRLIQQHPIESVRLLGDHPAVTEPVRQMILQHHERYDGRGYPLGLSGHELIVGSKILAIVDSFHAMIGRRAYKQGSSPAEALRVLSYQRGKQLDPDLYTRWIRLYKRCWHEQMAAPSGIDLPDDVGQSFHADHRQQRPADIPRTQQRLACLGRTSVECLHVGRLMNSVHPSSGHVFQVHDLSRGGLCLYTPQAMYRGEVLHVLLRTDGKPAVWVRGVVAWCRREYGKPGYRTGVKFVSRISADQSNEPRPVEALNDLHPLTPEG